MGDDPEAHPCGTSRINPAQINAPTLRCLEFCEMKSSGLLSWRRLNVLTVRFFASSPPSNALKSEKCVLYRAVIVFFAAAAAGWRYFLLIERDGRLIPSCR
jgi:hypothetical protein